MGRNGGELCFHHSIPWILSAPDKSIDDPVATHTVRLDSAQGKSEPTDSA